MRDHAREALDLTAGRGRADLDADRVLQLAVTRLLEIVGEAANRVPAEFRSAHASIPWTAIVGLRNRLIHGYDQVDPDVLWTILSTDLPALVRELNSLLDE